MTFDVKLRFELTQAQLERAQLLFRQVAEVICNGKDAYADSIYDMNPTIEACRRELSDMGVRSAYFRSNGDYTFASVLKEGWEFNTLFNLFCAEALPSVTKIIEAQVQEQAP